MATRKCSKCETLRDESDFYVRKDGGVNPWCKPCYRSWYEDRSGGVVTRQCDWCGAEMSVTQRRASEPRTFCSRPCKVSHRNAEAAAQRLASKPWRICLQCGGDMPPSMRANAKFCSASCNSAAHALKRKLRARGGYNETPGYVRVQIAERDGWRCGICGGRVSKDKRHPDPMCGSLDHLLPVSEGGDSEPSNLRLTHLVCNLRRGDRGGGEQLTLH